MELLQSGDGDDFSRDMAQKLTDIAREAPENLNKAAREMGNASGWDQMYEIWINNLLSGPQTHAVNTMSNTMVGMWQVPERYLASKIGQAMGTEGGVAAGEATAQAFGMVRGMKDGFRLAAKTLRSGEGSDLIGKMEQSHRAFTADNFAQTKAGRAVNAVTMGDLDSGGVTARAIDLMGEEAQKDVIADAHRAAENFVDRGVEILAADGKDTIPVVIGKLGHDGKKIAVTLECRKDDEHRYALLDATGGVGYLVVADPEKFKGGETPTPDPDQPDLMDGGPAMDNGQGFGSGEQAA